MTYKIRIQYKTILADLYTPVGIYNALRDEYPNALLFESTDYHDRSDNKSFICLQPVAEFIAKGQMYKYRFPGQEVETKEADTSGTVLKALKLFMERFEIKPSTLPFETQGLWGYSSFEAYQYLEDFQFPQKENDIKSNPDMLYQFFRYLLVFDHFKKELYIVEHSMDEVSFLTSDIDTILKIIGTKPQADFPFYTMGPETSTITDDEYRAMVSAGIRHCLIGDTFQVVLAREFRQRFKGDDFTLYRCLRSVNPSPYLFYLDYGDFKIFGSSPESQLQVHEHMAFINPIAGTVRRGDNAKKDQEMALALKNDEKENAEHVMLVDLARNDLSKHCDLVKVDTYAEIQYFSHVIHMVSKVSGSLSDKVHGLEVFADTFPAGTLSGAPKYRAVQIITEQEPDPRNFYGGAVGFFGFDGTVNHAIIIRSVLSRNNTLVYQAGAGIVAKSHPELELQEVNNKIGSIRTAIKKANEL